MRIKVNGAHVHYRVVCEDFTLWPIELARAKKMMAKATEVGACRHTHRIVVDFV